MNWVEKLRQTICTKFEEQQFCWIFVWTNRISLKENPPRFYSVPLFKFKLYRLILFFDLQCKLQINSIFMNSHRCKVCDFFTRFAERSHFIDFVSELMADRVKRHKHSARRWITFAWVSVPCHISQHFFMCFCSDKNNSIPNRCFCCYYNSVKKKSTGVSVEISVLRKS